MYEELIKQLRWMEDVRKKDISCPVPCINECLFKEAADAIEKIVKERDDQKTTAKLERDGIRSDILEEQLKNMHAAYMNVVGACGVTKSKQRRTKRERVD